jgi:hypothetical protein
MDDTRNDTTGIALEVERNLEILGFAFDDCSQEAEMAQTWVLATLDDDEEWFEKRSMETIRAAYASWRRSV